MNNETPYIMFRKPRLFRIDSDKVKTPRDVARLLAALNIQFTEESIEAAGIRDLMQEIDNDEQ